jgi:hypothetical protein
MIEQGRRGLPFREAPRLVEVLLAEYAARQEWARTLEEFGLTHLTVKR